MTDNEDTYVNFQVAQNQEIISQNSPIKLNYSVNYFNSLTDLLIKWHLILQQVEEDDKLIYANSSSSNNYINTNTVEIPDKIDTTSTDNTSQSVSQNNQIHNVSHLSRVRVIKKNLVYVIGIAPQLANEQILQSYQYFGQYGNISKIVVNKNNIYNPKGPNGPSYSAYITYTEEKEASLSILGTENFKIFDRIIRASYGTTKYCSYFLKKQDCPNIPDCLYLHSYEKDDDYFSKDEMLSNKNIFIDQQKIAIKHVKKYIPEILSEYQQNKNFYESQSHIFALPNLSKVIEKLREYGAITIEQYQACKEYQPHPNHYVIGQYAPNLINQQGLNQIYGSFVAQNTVISQQKVHDYDCKVQQSPNFNPFSQNQEMYPSQINNLQRQQVYYEKKNNFLSSSAISMNQGFYSFNHLNQSPLNTYYPFSPPIIKPQYLSAQSQSEYLNVQYCMYDQAKQMPQVTPFEINDSQSSQDSIKCKSVSQKYENYPPNLYSQNTKNNYQQFNDNINFFQSSEEKLNSQVQQEIINTIRQEYSQLKSPQQNEKQEEDVNSENKEYSKAEKYYTHDCNSNYQYSTQTETNKEFTDSQSQQSIEDNLNLIQLESQNSKDDVINKIVFQTLSIKKTQSQISDSSQKSNNQIKSNCSLGDLCAKEEANKIQSMQKSCYEQDSQNVKEERNTSQNKFDSGNKTLNINYEIIANFWDGQDHFNNQNNLQKQQNKYVGQLFDEKTNQPSENKVQDEENQEKNAFYSYESEQNSFQELCSGFNTFVLTKFY